MYLLLDLDDRELTTSEIKNYHIYYLLLSIICLFINSDEQNIIAIFP